MVSYDCLTVSRANDLAENLHGSENRGLSKKITDIDKCNKLQIHVLLSRCVNLWIALNRPNENKPRTSRKILIKLNQKAIYHVA